MRNEFMKKIVSCVALLLLMCTVMTGCGKPEEGGSTDDITSSVPSEDPTQGSESQVPSQGPSSSVPTGNATTNPTAKPTVNQELRFNSSGNFKIVIFSDLRLSKKVDTKVIDNMKKVLDKEKPSLVIFGGDIHDGTISNEKDLRTILDAVNAPLEDRKILWCHAFGVDAEGTAKKKTGYKKADQMKVYQSYPYCVSKASGSDVYGVSNFVLPIKQANNKVGFNVWCLDANGYLNDYEAGLEDKVLLGSQLSGNTNLDCIHFTQRLWYWNQSLKFQEQNGGKVVPGMMYFQVPPFQFRYIIKNKDRTNMQGSAVEKISASERDSGIISTFFNRQDIKGVFCGYNEQNDFSGTYMNMLFACCSTIGQTKSASTAGARVVNITKNGANMESYMVHLSKLY